MLKIHNSLTGEKEEFKPLRANEVRMYVCGMTNYDYIHVGHARMLTVFDLMQRYLRSLGYKVTYVRNITDIDDKIIERAAANGENWADLARRFTAAMHEDCATLGLQAPDLEPRATEFIGPIIAMTQTLIDKGYAYVAGNGDVMYSVRKFPSYGRLRARKSTICAPARACRWMTPSSIPWISCCGSTPSRASLPGPRPGERAGPAGTSNAPPCRRACSAAISICTAAARI